MKIIIPMAGRGSRFSHIKLPKPLIKVLGKPMVQWSIESLKTAYPPAKSHDFIFICLEEHEKQFQISKTLKKLAGNDCTIRYLKTTTEGPVCTVLSIKDLINNNEDMMTCDCDQYFICPNFYSHRNQARKNNWGGLIPTYDSSSPNYSYVQLGKNGNAIKTAEKQVISRNAAIGIYYFTKGEYFVRYAHEMIKKNIRYNNEFYMTPLYNLLIQSGKIVRIVPTKKWMTLGTPSEAEKFIKKMSKK